MFREVYLRTKSPESQRFIKQNYVKHDFGNFSNRYLAASSFREVAYVRSTVIEQISLSVPTRMFGPQMPAPEVTILCMESFFR